MDVMQLGHNLLVLAGILSVGILAFSSIGLIRRSGRFVEMARVGFYLLFVVIAATTGCLVYGFTAGVYNVQSVYNHSEQFLPLSFKVACLWAGLDGSLLFWTFLLCGLSAIAAYQHRPAAASAAGRRLEPYVYLILAAIALFFVLVTWSENPFKSIPIDQRLRLAHMHGVPLDEHGNLLDGVGLNQQLVNYWFVIHPPTLYLGFVAWTIPFAFGLAGVLANDLGSHWVRTVRRWSMVSWIFLTSGIVLGGLWAYRQLGWGGYWAWDPVENASLLPWLTGTAFVHSLLVMERRDLLKGWTVFLLCLTFFLTIVATWMTRSAVVSSIHAFAGGAIGTWFQIFLFVIAGGTAFVLAWRSRTLRGTDRIDAILSRESVFFLNNLVLVIIAAVVFGLSFLPKISHDWFASMRTDQDGAAYNTIATPFFVVLLALTALGPGLSWIRTTPATLARNFRTPLVATVVFLLLLYAYFAWKGLLPEGLRHIGADGEPRNAIFSLSLDVANQPPTALYPTGIVLGLCFFTLAAVATDIARGVRARVRNRGEGILQAAGRLAVRNNRRYGGYVVHAGLAILAAGIVISSMFKEREEFILKVGDAGRVGPYLVSPISETVSETPVPGEPYAKVQVLFRVYRVPSGGLRTAHGEVKDIRQDLENARVVAELLPERRFYPKKREWISEVTIWRRPLEDIYIFFSGRDQTGKIGFVVHLNPFMAFLYLGWFAMVGGSVFAALPLGGRKGRARWDPVRGEAR